MESSKQLTQRQLDYIFVQLGYHVTEVENGPRVWENPQFDAVMLLPAMAPDQPARLQHLLGLRRIAIEKGIIEPEAFDALLERAHHEFSQSSVSTTAA